ncbi:hypothetical protein ACIBG0_39070 [Nocardia sp. NPDC050630]|uniref:hypothetical protein n=1 Tax=Nocardia sp. NPDC050630 TaxID=3364321 RepID=UPI0037BD4AD3
MTTPHLPSAPPDAFVVGTDYGSNLDEDTVKAVTTGGAKVSFTNVQNSINNPVGNVLPTGAPLWQTFTREADATFPRIMLARKASGVTVNASAISAGSHTHSVSGSSTSSAGSHSHTVSASGTIQYAVPDYQPAGHGANLTEIGFIECSKDRTYNNFSFITGDSWTLLGIGAFYLAVYKMDPSTGNLSLVAKTNDIKGSVGSTDTEYTFGLNNSIAAKKADIFGLATLQVTSPGQTCNSICQLTFWPLSAPSGFKPAALYAYAGGSSTPLSSIGYSSLTFNSGFVPYYALS